MNIESPTAGSRWWRCVYGKRVVEPNGPIVRGFEHSITGHTNSMPLGLISLCMPDKLGLGEEGAQVRAYPWRKGGLGLRPVWDRGKWYQFAFRVRFRSEGGEGSASRSYTQAVYFAREIQTPDNLDFPRLDLPNCLQAEPMLQNAESELDPVDSVPDADWANELLDWETTAKNILVPLLCGQPVSIQKAKTLPDDFYLTAMTVLAMLPRAIRWQFPIGAGMFQIDDVALGHGLTALGGIRQIGDERLEYESIEGTPAVEMARFYVNQLSPTQPTIKALCEAANRLAEENPCDFSIEKQDVQALWQTNAHLLINKVYELRKAKEVEQYLRGGPKANGPDAWQLAERLQAKMIREAAVCLYANTSGSIERALDVLWKTKPAGQSSGGKPSAASSRPDWSAGWKECLNDNCAPDYLHGMAALLGVSTEVNPLHIIALNTFDFPESAEVPNIKDHIYDRLRRLVLTEHINNANASGWFGLFEKCYAKGGINQRWLRGWGEKNTDLRKWWKYCLLLADTDQHIKIRVNLDDRDKLVAAIRQPKDFGIDHVDELIEVLRKANKGGERMLTMVVKQLCGHCARQNRFDLALVLAHKYHNLVNSFSWDLNSHLEPSAKIEVCRQILQSLKGAIDGESSTPIEPPATTNFIQSSAASGSVSASVASKIGKRFAPLIKYLFGQLNAISSELQGEVLRILNESQIQIDESLAGEEAQQLTTILLEDKSNLLKGNLRFTRIAKCLWRFWLNEGRVNWSMSPKELAKASLGKQRIGFGRRLKLVFGKRPSKDFDVLLKNLQCVYQIYRGGDPIKKSLDELVSDVKEYLEKRT